MSGFSGFSLFRTPRRERKERKQEREEIERNISLKKNKKLDLKKVGENLLGHVNPKEYPWVF